MMMMMMSPVMLLLFNSVGGPLPPYATVSVSVCLSVPYVANIS